MRIINVTECEGKERIKLHLDAEVPAIRPTDRDAMGLPTNFVQTTDDKITLSWADATRQLRAIPGMDTVLVRTKHVVFDADQLITLLLGAECTVTETLHEAGEIIPATEDNSREYTYKYDGYTYELSAIKLAPKAESLVQEIVNSFYDIKSFLKA